MEGGGGRLLGAATIFMGGGGKLAGVDIDAAHNALSDSSQYRQVAKLVTYMEEGANPQAEPSWEGPCWQEEEGIH
jgi:hypothetical protein